MKNLIKLFITYFCESKIYIIFLSKTNFFKKLFKYYGSFPDGKREKLFLKYNFSSGAWIETGTYKGETTEFLSTICERVYSIEAQEALYHSAKKRLSYKNNIHLVLGTSEECLENVINSIKNDKVSFWLDAHFSKGGTFEGSKHCPVLEELDVIKKHLSKFNEINILIDDFSNFNNFTKRTKKINFPDYKLLLEWAKENKFKWFVSRDILVLNR